MFPICVDVSIGTGVPVHQVVAVLCIAAACQMLSPVSYQTNLMAYTAGSYEFADFPKVGFGAVALMMVVGIFTCRLCFPPGTYHTTFATNATMHPSMSTVRTF